MTKLFKPATPQIPKMAETAPSAATPAVQAAGEAERLRQRRARGVASTMLSGGGGESAPIGTTKLLGG